LNLFRISDFEFRISDFRREDVGLPYILNTPADREAMLAQIGIGSVEDLFRCIPESLRLARPLDVPPWHLPELARRRDDAEARPGVGKPWREVLGPVESGS
jgi:hypothetical protein